MTLYTIVSDNDLTVIMANLVSARPLESDVVCN